MKPILSVFAKMVPDDIEPHHMWTYWRSRGEIEQSKHEIRALSAVLTFGRQCGAMRNQNPCYGLHLPKKPDRDLYVTDDAFLFVRDRAQTMVGYAMDLAYIAGLDQSTIRKLERKHLTNDGIEVARSKTGKLQIIEWNDELRLIVRGILSERPQLRRVLICNGRGQAYSANGFQSQWQRLMRKCKADGFKDLYHFHDLRGKSASDAETDQEASDRLNHSSVEFTRRVYRRLPRRAPALRILDR
jgi:integrase